MIRIGIDLGGTKIEGIVLDSSGAERARQRVPSPRNDYDATLKTIVDLVGFLESRCGPSGTVGVGIPGIVSPATGLVKNANSTWLIGHPLDRDLTARLGRPVRLENDANCFALSEATDGAGAAAAVVFGVILGTGVGGGIVVCGRPLVGANAIAGEWGHNPLPSPRDEERPGPTCYCGRRGCVETFLSGPAIEHDYKARVGITTPAVEIGRRAAAGEAAAESVLADHEDRLARALSVVINILDPDVIVLGGGVSNLDRLYANVPRLWAPHVFSDRVDTKLVRARHGDSSGVRGAARLWNV
ncbi:MAG: ROK family protein [Nitrospirae bacterium]|nr:ROK family protein [Nitrospirota bacterium]